MCWTAIIVYIVDRKWWQAAVWAAFSALIAAVGVIHVPVSSLLEAHAALTLGSPERSATAEIVSRRRSIVDRAGELLLRSGGLGIWGTQ